MVGVRKSAYKHGATKEDIDHAIENALLLSDLNPSTEPSRLLIIGPDKRGNLLEVIALDEPNGEISVIHSMKMRKQFEPLLRRNEEK